MRFLRLSLFPLVVALLAFPGALRAAIIADLLTKIQQSEFVFPKSESNAPFVPVAWVNATFYSDSSVNLKTGRVQFKVWSESQALMAPVWVGKKDMVIAGEYGSWQQIKISAPNPSQLNITTIIPVLAWARQIDPKMQGAVFVAPNFVNGGKFNGYSLKQTTVYSGLVAFRWNSDRFAWGGGVINYRSDGSALWLPYVGALWRPAKEFSVALVLPWPSLSYAPTPHTLYTLGLAPAGATLGGSRDGQKLTVGFSSWNLMVSVHRQLTKSLWLSAGAGRSGFGSFTVSSNGDPGLKHELDRGPVFSLQLSVRPPTAAPSVAK